MWVAVSPLAAKPSVPTSAPPTRGKPDAVAVAAADHARQEELAAMVAERQAAARRAIAAARRLTGRPAADDAATAGPRTLRMLVTAYCACTKCCGPNARGVTASGRPVSHNQGRFVAADTTVLPFRTKLAVPGYHDAAPVEVVDTGSAIKGHRLDVYFPSHRTALEWGKRWVDVTVVE